MNPMTLTPSSARPLAGFRGRFLLAAFALVLASVAFACGGHRQYSSVVVFGDSLCDTGRLYQLSGAGFPMKDAYWRGRQSNGPVWVEYLAFALGCERRLQNYAVVGALTGPTPDIPSGNVWSDTYANLTGTSVAGQLAQFIADTGGKADPEALYLVEGGANDFIHPLQAAMGSPTPPDPAEFAAVVQQLATRAITNIVTTVVTLRQLGAKYIAVVNLPDFGYAPRFARLGGSTQQAVFLVVGTVNSGLDGTLDQLDAATSTTTARIDAAAIIDGVVTAPDHDGFRNVADPLMTRDPATGKVTLAAPRHAAAFWFFWDDLHPTTMGHLHFAEQALTAIRTAFPATQPAGHHHR